MPKLKIAAGAVVVTVALADVIADSVNLQNALAKPPEINELAVLTQVDAAENYRTSEHTMRRSESFAVYFRSITRHQAGDFERALEDLQRTLALDPDSQTLVDETAHLMAGSGRLAAGRQLYEAFLQRQGNDPETSLRFSRFCENYQRDDPALQQRALEVLQEAYEEFDDSMPLAERLVSMLLSLGYRSEARNIGEKLTSSPSDESGYWLRVAGMARDIWPVSAGKENRNRVNGLFEKARSLAPDDRGVNGTVGDYYAATRQYKEAKTVYRAMINRYPQALLEREKLVRVYRITNENELAMRELEALVRIDAHRPTAQKLLAEMHESLGNFGKAVDHFSTLLSLGEPSLEDYRKLADLCAAAGRHEEAVKYLQRAGSMSPESPEAAILLADALLESGAFAEAVTKYEMAEALAEEHGPEALAESFYFNYSLAAAQAGMVPRAEELLRRSIGLVPADQPELAAKSLNQLGYLWLEQGKNIDQAGINIQRALELEPDRPEYLDSLGWYHHLKGDNERALNVLLEALEKLSRPDATIHHHAAEVYSALGKKAEAVQQLRKAISLDPANTLFQERLSEFSQ
ncbi:MAG: tetratricopeptide repeat protein [Verrucomicrobiota bacterium]